MDILLKISYIMLIIGILSEIFCGVKEVFDTWMEKRKILNKVGATILIVVLTIVSITISYKVGIYGIEKIFF